ncbi:MAG: response regulator [Acidobacteria bacterium]|nr:response regulator [Acidobacteriota bacterium]
MSVSLNNSQVVTGARHAPRARPLVLVTDDDENTRSLFRTLLEISGYAVIEAEDGEQAIRLAESAQPDLILMDGRLPRLDGFTATRRIRELGHAGRVPIVFVSGHAEPAFLALAREAGCDEYLVKPFSLDQLDGLLEKYLAHHARAFAI